MTAGRPDIADHGIVSGENPPRLHSTNKDVELGYKNIEKWILPEVKIVELPVQWVAYIRHTGYNRDIKNAWNTLKAWTVAENINFTQL